MGDEPSGGGNPLSEPSKFSQRHGQSEKFEKPAAVQSPINPIVESVPHQTAQSFHFHHNLHPSVQSQQSHHPYASFFPQGAPNNVFGTGNLMSALPDYSRGSMGTQFQSHQAQQQNQRGSTAALTPAVVYQLQQNLQFAGQTTALLEGNQPTNHNVMHAQLRRGFSGAQNQHAGNYEGLLGSHAMAQNVNHHLHPAYQQSQQYTYWPTFYSNPAMLSPSVLQKPGPYERRSSAPLASEHYPSGAIQPAFYNTSGRTTINKAFGSDYGTSGLAVAASYSHGIKRHMSDSGLSTMPRGPPRKPKQSGHALWVGNLPPGTNIVDLKNFFSRDAMNDIESLFLISKSNCAFVNYKTEAACAAAMRRFHDSRFYGVRLVCRLRRSATPARGTPIGPSGTVLPQPPIETAQTNDEANEVDGDVGSKAEGSNEESTPNPSVSSSKVAEKYFIVKSLTLQDLELSVRNGIWATQSHNEEKFNYAYRTADKVYLIFSANKSGEYFGYARMTSPILSDAEEIQRKLPSPLSQSSALEAPKAIPTPETETAPKGHIIDDSARGTIFWEADRSDSDENDGPTSELKDNIEPESDPDVPATWGKPFRIEWLSTARLPFFRTRGLRNPWNANREVKIARDGTELESNVGRRLVQMFVGPGQVLSAGVAP